jgi:hypothetical protein
MTHRVFSRNAASSRAIPIDKIIKRVEEFPVIPVEWGMNQGGMQADRLLEDTAALRCTEVWLRARDQAVRFARDFKERGVHKQLVNRILEPWMWITVIVSSTDWANFFSLRCHTAAQPEIRKIANLMQEAYFLSKPRFLAPGRWHMPLLPDLAELVQDGYRLDSIKKISVGRCARVSYLTHFGSRNPKEDIELHDRLVKDGHWSPFEHVAMAMEFPPRQSGNFLGYEQYRQQFKTQNRTTFKANIPNLNGSIDEERMFGKSRSRWKAVGTEIMCTATDPYKYVIDNRNILKSGLEFHTVAS